MQIIFIIIFSNAQTIDTILIPSEIHSIKAFYDGNELFYVLDDRGEVTSIDLDGVIVAKLEMSSYIPDFFRVNDIAFSAGWLYLADRDGEAIYLTDKRLREPSKVSLQLAQLSIRPSLISVSTDGRIMIYDHDRNKIYLLDDWRAKRPIEIILRNETDNERIVNINYDRFTNYFTVTSDRAVYLYTTTGAFHKVFQLEIASPISAFTVVNNFTIIGEHNAQIFDLNYSSYYEINTCKITSATQEISGKALVICGNKILRVNSLKDLE